MQANASTLKQMRANESKRKQQESKGKGASTCSQHLMACTAGSLLQVTHQLTTASAPSPPVCHKEAQTCQLLPCMQGGCQ